MRAAGAGSERTKRTNVYYGVCALSFVAVRLFLAKGSFGEKVNEHLSTKASPCRLSGPSRNRDFFLCSEGPPAQPLANRS